MSDHNQEQPRLPLSPEEAQAGSRGEELVDLREEGRHRIRVLAAVADFMKGKRKRHGC